MKVRKSDTEQVTEPVGASALDRLVRGNTKFALSLHKALAKSSQENMLLSPYSISIALGMTYAGSRKKTRSQMRDVLQFKVSADRLHHAFGTLSAKLDPPNTEKASTTTMQKGTTIGEQNGAPFTLDTVNTIWGQRGFPWRDAYLDTLSKYYGAGLNVVDFKTDHEAARQQINSWVSDQTNQKIQKLFPSGSLSDLTRLVLTNAVYFHANWQHTFQKDQTTQKPFTALDGSTTKVPMMVQDLHELPYTEKDGLQAVELRYAGGEVGMVIVLPPEGSFQSFEQSLTSQRLQAIFDSLTSTQGTLRLPRFAFNSSFGLSKILSSLGMPIAFNPQKANFTGMYHRDQVGRNLSIGDIRHKTHIAVDEEGTEAAAATGVEAVLISGSMNPYEMTVDRPFLFCIRHQPTDTFLFLGRVVEATSTSENATK